MASEKNAAVREDPLVAALPPTTDYITYLTLLEYQLRPDNLHILNGLLKADDGTLAKEIGWDLLRLVLPLLQQVPDEANDCLDIIARRGNPREVVVRIAEELEKIGQIDQNSDDEAELSEDDDLRTFSGEAARIHLGQMKLEGISEPTSREHDQVPDDNDSHSDLDARSVDLESLEFPALLRMLGTVHPRIKTQHPSRFLATSLPAALAAYRRMPITCQSTVAFLDCLSRLIGRDRPPLPARDSVTTLDKTASISAPLPDPEASKEASEGTNVASTLEKGIISRLLQAVLLEVVDEYMSSLQGDDVPTMLWTRRLRESSEPNKILPSRINAASMFEKESLAQRTSLVKKMGSLSKALGLDLLSEVEKLIDQTSVTSDGRRDDDQQEDEPSEYPTSPSQISFPSTGVTLLLAATIFTAEAPSRSLDLRQVASLIDVITPLSEMPSIPNPSVQDALNSLLHRAILDKGSAVATDMDPSASVRLLSILTQTFTITPDSQTRDDAHFLATKLVHLQPDVNIKLDIIKQTLRCMTTSNSGTAPSASNEIPLATTFTEGALKAVGVGWLKEEFLSFFNKSQQQKQSNYTSSTPSLDADTFKKSEPPSGLDPDVLTQDKDLNTLIYHPGIPAPTDTHLLHTQIVMNLPFFIALLNLNHVLVSHYSSVNASASTTDTNSGTGTSASFNTNTGRKNQMYQNTTSLLQTLTPWVEHLVKKLSDAVDDDDDDNDNDHHDDNEAADADSDKDTIRAAAADIYAFEDAALRLRGVIC